MRYSKIVGLMLVGISAVFILVYFLSNEDYRELNASIFRDHPFMVVATLAFLLGAVILNQRDKQRNPHE